jgi:hypothetical protein
MKRLLPIALSVFTTLCLLLATEHRAWGYVDPGSGFLALQTGASVMAACGYFFRRRILTLFRSKPEKEKAMIPVTIQKGDSRNAA